MTATPGTPPSAAEVAFTTAPASPAAPPTKPVLPLGCVVALLLTALALGGFTAYKNVPAGALGWPSWLTTRVAAARITAAGGGVAPATVRTGGLVGLSAETSDAGTSPLSVRWTVDPADAAAESIPFGRGLMLAAGVAPRRITVRLAVARGDTVDVATHVVVVGGGGPDPGPSPGPSPGPYVPPYVPPDAAPYPAIRDAATAHFAAYARRYAGDAEKVGTLGYNALMDAQAADHKVKAAAVGQAIDAVVRPLLDDAGNYKNAASAALAYRGIAASLEAGRLAPAPRVAE